MTDWGLQQVTIPRNAVILDIGCGGGWTVHKLAALAPEGKVIGLDYSAASIAVSCETNAEQIKVGRVQIAEASVAALPFPDCTFDIVTAVETHYYWPNLPANMQEVHRVLKPGGSFALIAETYRGGPFRLLYGTVMPLLRAAFLTDEEHQNLLAQAGLAMPMTSRAKLTTLRVRVRVPEIGLDRLDNPRGQGNRAGRRRSCLCGRNGDQPSQAEQTIR